MKIFTFKEIPVFIHRSFLWILLFYVGMNVISTWESTFFEIISNGIFTFALVITLFACVLLHEFGHAFAARYYGYATKSITIFALGGLAAIEGDFREIRPKKEFVIALAGPLVNLVIGFLLLALILIFWPEASMHEFIFGQNMELHVGQAFLHTLTIANFILFFFNLAPVYPMDGGRILRAFLRLFSGPITSMKIASYIAIILCVATIFFALINLNLMLLLIACLILLINYRSLNEIRIEERNQEFEQKT